MADKFTYYSAIDDLPNDQLEQVIFDFVIEQKLLGEFLVWLEKWKSLRHM